MPRNIGHNLRNALDFYRLKPFPKYDAYKNEFTEEISVFIVNTYLKIYSLASPFEAENRKKLATA